MVTRPAAAQRIFRGCVTVSGDARALVDAERLRRWMLWCLRARANRPQTATTRSPAIEHGAAPSILPRASCALPRRHLQAHPSCARGPAPSCAARSEFFRAEPPRNQGEDHVTRPHFLRRRSRYVSTRPTCSCRHPERVDHALRIGAAVRGLRDRTGRLQGRASHGDAPRMRPALLIVILAAGCRAPQPSGGVTHGRR